MDPHASEQNVAAPRILKLDHPMRNRHHPPYDRATRNTLNVLLSRPAAGGISWVAEMLSRAKM